jgi:hypothetical protein
MKADDLPRAAVIHSVDGRTRLRVAARRENAAFFSTVAAGLSAIAGVRKVEVRPLTASILIFHDAPISRIGEAAEKNGLFSLAEATKPSASLEGPALQISPRMVAAAGLGLIALWQVYKEKFFPSALTVGFYAVNIAGLLPTDDASGGSD